MRKFLTTIVTVLLFLCTLTACSKKEHVTETKHIETSAAVETETTETEPETADENGLISVVEHQTEPIIEETEIKEINFILPRKDAVRINDGFFVEENTEDGVPRVWITKNVLLKVMGDKCLTDEEIEKELLAMQDCEGCKTVSEDQWEHYVKDADDAITFISKDGKNIHRKSVDVKVTQSEYGAPMTDKWSTRTNINVSEDMTEKDGETYYNAFVLNRLYPSKKFDHSISITKTPTSYNIELTQVESVEPADVTTIPVYDHGEAKTLGDYMTGSYLIYFRREDCPDCKMYEESIKSQLTELGMRYITIEVLREPENFDGLSIASADAKKLGITQIPSIVYIKNNKYNAVIEHPNFTLEGGEITKFIEENK